MTETSDPGNGETGGNARTVAVVVPTVQSEFLPMGIRAWPVQTQNNETPKSKTDEEEKPKKPKRRYPHEALVFDTETRDEPGQGLLLGIWRLYIDNLDAEPGTHLVEEGFFYPDDLPEADPVGFETLRNYVSTRRATEVAPGKSPEILLWPESRWLEQRLHNYGYKHRNRCSVVGFNLPFDLGALAKHFSAARAPRGGYGIDYYGGWSLSFFGSPRADGSWHDPRHKPRLRMKSIDPRRTLIGWAPIEDDEPAEKAKGAGGGQFVDLRTLAFALTDRSLTLEGACTLFGHPYEKREVEYGVITEQMLDYGREDVAATATLYRSCLTELARHPGVELPPHRLYSPATVGARYLDAMGLAHPLERFPLPPGFLGRCMSGFFGGRAEARIVRTPVPVVVADFTSMYPAQNALLHTWEILTAESVELHDVTDQVRALIADPNLFDRLHNKHTWAEDIGVTFVEIADVNGAVLPTRAEYETQTAAGGSEGSAPAGNLGIGINPLHYDGTLTYGLPDILAACLLGPPSFRIIKATRVRPVGRQPGLRPVKLRGAVDLDPTSRDPFLSMIEDRHRVKNDPTLSEAERDRLELFLKITANATSYGSLARFDRAEKPKPVEVDAYGPGGDKVTANITSPETPGPYCFPPVAASITAGARLVLAMMETHVTRRGGSYAFMDTDSTAIVATPTGGQVPCPGEPDGTLLALSHAQVYDILRSFDDLNPFGPVVMNPDPELPRSPWKVEKDSIKNPLNAYVISTKRYVLYQGDPDNPELVHTSDDDADNDIDETDDDADLDLEDWSEHGIGLYQDPIGRRDKKGRRIWMRQAWGYILRRALGADPEPPAWSNQPALTQFTMSSPRQRRWFGSGDSGTPTPNIPRPASFGLLAQTDPTSCTGNQVPMPVGSYTSNPSAWSDIDWCDRSTGTPLRINTADPDQQPNAYAEDLAAGHVQLRTLGNVLNRYQTRTEHKSLAPDGTPTGPDTRGKLPRRPVHARAATTHLIGKESNKLAERTTGADPTPGEAVTTYGTVGDYWTDVTLPVLRQIGAPAVAEACQVSERTVRRWFNGTRPHDGPSGHMTRATNLATQWGHRQRL